MQLSQIAFSQLFLSAGATLVVWIVFKAAARIIRILKSPLRDMGGPDNPHWFYGNYREIMRTVSRLYHLLHNRSSHVEWRHPNSNRSRITVCLSNGCKNMDLRWSFMVWSAYVAVSSSALFPWKSMNVLRNPICARWILELSTMSSPIHTIITGRRWLDLVLRLYLARVVTPCLSYKLIAHHSVSYRPSSSRGWST